jgi:hypothetical protein
MKLPQWVKDQQSVKAAEQMTVAKPAPYTCSCGATYTCPQDLVACQSGRAETGA